MRWRKEDIGFARNDGFDHPLSPEQMPSAPKIHVANPAEKLVEFAVVLLFLSESKLLQIPPNMAVWSCIDRITYMRDSDTSSEATFNDPAAMCLA